MRRPPREAYVRVEVEWEGMNVTPGLELRPSDRAEDLITELHHLLDEQHGPHLTALEAALEVEHRILLAFPGRAYFVEVYPPGDDGWIQIFQPFGIPRNDPGEP